jgi:hypothetical protein
MIDKTPAVITSYHKKQLIITGFTESLRRLNEDIFSQKLWQKEKQQCTKIYVDASHLNDQQI